MRPRKKERNLPLFKLQWEERSRKCFRAWNWISWFLQQTKYITESIKSENGRDPDIPRYKVRERLQISLCNRYGQTFQWQKEFGKVFLQGVTASWLWRITKGRKTKLKSVFLVVQKQFTSLNCRLRISFYWSRTFSNHAIS